MDDVVAITWEVHRRTRSICREFGVVLHEIVSSRTGIARYLDVAFRTLGFLARHRPRVLLVQNPSLVLAGMAAVYRRLCSSTTLLVDAHNVAIEQLMAKNAAVRAMARFAIRAADLTIVTNGALAEHVRAFGGKPVVLPDPLPIPPFDVDSGLARDTNIVSVIATYAADEPIADILAAAALLGTEFSFRFTGRADGWLRGNATQIPSSVRFTGYLAEQDYWQLLEGSRVIVDLTTREACLVCGAYEALAVGRPLVLSDTQANRQVFGQVACYAELTPKAIAEAIVVASARYLEICEKSAGARHAYRATWNVLANDFRESVGALRDSGRSRS